MDWPKFVQCDQASINPLVPKERRRLLHVGSVQNEVRLLVTVKSVHETRSTLRLMIGRRIRILLRRNLNLEFANLAPGFCT